MPDISAHLWTPCRFLVCLNFDCCSELIRYSTLLSFVVMSNSSCPLFLTASSRQAVKNVGYAAYLYIWPTCLFLDIIGHCLCFVAFYKESKKNGVYAFQFYDAVAKAADTFSAFLNLASWKWFASFEYWGVDWFQRNYALMWYTAHVAIPFNDMTTTISVLISLAMTIDRAFSIGIPFRYKKLNKKWWQIGAVLFAVVVGAAINLYTCFIFAVQQASDRYVVVFNAPFALGPAATALTYLKILLWIGSLAAVTISGFTLVYLYHMRTSKVASMTTAHTDDDRESRRRAAEKTLFMLTTYSTIQTANVMGVLTAHSLLALVDGFSTCGQKLFGPLRAIEVSLVNGSDFYVLLLISPAFRKMIRNALPCKRESDHGNSSAPVLSNK